LRQLAKNDAKVVGATASEGFLVAQKKNMTVRLTTNMWANRITIAYNVPHIKMLSSTKQEDQLYLFSCGIIHKVEDTAN